MIIGTLSFLFGNLALQHLSQLPSVWFLLASIIFFLMSWLIAKNQLTKILLCFALGFCWTGLYAHYSLRWTLPKNIEKKTIVVSGNIASIPNRRQDRVGFLLKTKKIAGRSVNTIIKLNWYSKNTPMLQLGDEMQLNVRLKRPHGNLNPGGFDYERWLFANHIRAVGYVRNGKTISHAAEFHDPIGLLRQKINNLLTIFLANKKLGGIIPALVIGDRSGITPEQWQVFRSTGTSHLVAISGLHIGLVSGLVFLIVGFLWKRSSQLLLYIPAPQAAAIAGLLAALIYSALAGFALPTQRALIMITVFMSSILLRRHVAPWSSLTLAMLLILIVDPLATLSASFWLSFAAVFLMIVGLAGRLNQQTLWWKWGRAQWVVAIGLLPISLLWFQQASLIAFLANLIAIPVVGFVVVPLSLVGSLLLLVSTTLGGAVVFLADMALKMVWIYLHWLANFSFANWHVAFVFHWQFVVVALGVLLIIAPRGFPLRKLGMIFLLPLVFIQTPTPQFGNVWFTLLDVGQGLSTVVRTEHHVLVYDTGAKLSPTFDYGKMVLIPFLRVRGINQIDDLIISHGDNDHIGGSQSLLLALPVKNIITSVPKRFPDRTAIFCKTGMKWQWDGVYFEILGPPNSKIFQRNNASCVLKITTGKNSVLLTGDIQKPAEKFLLKHESAELHSSILVVPHHGSKTSSSLPFIKSVDPSYALISTGYLNRYRLPSKIVLIRYHQINSTLLGTVNSGAISFQITPDKLSLPSQYRKTFHHYWNS